MPTFSVVALAMVAPTILASKYALQMLKNLLPFERITPDSRRTACIRLTALVVGAVLLTALTVSTDMKLAFATITIIREVPFDALLGAGAGLAAIGDYHLLDFFQNGSTPTVFPQTSAPLPPAETSGVVVVPPRTT